MLFVVRVQVVASYEVPACPLPRPKRSGIRITGRGRWGGCGASLQHHPATLMSSVCRRTARLNPWVAYATSGHRAATGDRDARRGRERADGERCGSVRSIGAYGSRDARGASDAESAPPCARKRPVAERRA